MSKANNKLVFFGRNEMIKYFQRFDYLDIKIAPLADGLGADYYPFLKKAMCDYELRKNHTVYADIKYLDVRDKVKIIYGDEDGAAEKMTYVYDFAVSRLLDRYIDIDTLIKLFNHHFFEFEWRQHIDYNFKENDLCFYRDHFIHQIRNCYMILRLLDGVTNDSVKKSKTKKVIGLSSGINIVDGSVKRELSPLMAQIKETLKNSLDNELMKNVRVAVNNYTDRVKDIVNNFIVKMDLVDGAPTGDKKEVENLLKKNAEDFSWEYLIRGTLIIACLFHDIGYPVKFMQDSADQLNDFIASILPQNGLDFDKLNDLLGSSLLFTLVKKDVLKKMFYKRDHGTLSAVILLLHFYETGIIHSLNDIKKMMVEYAALAIFNHTVTNYYKDRKDVSYKASFIADPISYTLRFIDDLQEWERVYFEVRKMGDLRYCEKCKMPIGKIWNTDIENKIADIAKGNIQNSINIPETILYKMDFADLAFPDSNMKRVYTCGCGDKIDKGGLNEKDWSHANHIIDGNKFMSDGWHFCPGLYEKGTLFPDRKINYTVISTNQVVIDESQDDSPKYTFYLDYDPFRTFYLIKMNSHALDYRIGDLKTLNEQFEYQKGIDFKMVTNMTNNPFMLKLRILCDFLYEYGHYLYNVIKFKKNLGQEDIALEFSRKINLLYVKMLPSKETDRKSEFNFIYYFSRKMKKIGFFNYDFDDENISSIEKVESTDAESFQTLSIDRIVEFLMREKKKKRGKANIYITNLCNTLSQYFKLAKAIANEDNINNIEFNTVYFTDYHKTLCSYLFSDAVKQIDSLYKNYNFIEYYKKDFDKEQMAQANQILFDPQYYNPMIIQTNCVNKDRFDFFDALSDLYLFKEMYRFSQDNFRRRIADL